MKARTNISVEANVLEEAQKKFPNQVSMICEDALRIKCNPKKSDMPEDNLSLKCSKCNNIVDNGYYCEIKKIFNCKDCEMAFIEVKNGDKKTKYPCHVHEAEHFHLLIPGENDINLNIAKELEQ